MCSVDRARGERGKRASDVLELAALDVADHPAALGHHVGKRGELVVEQPAQKVTKTVSTIADILGAVAAATGHENTARRAGKVSQTVQKDIRVKNLVYADGRFSVNGIGRGTLEALAVETLNSIFAKAGK